jgi:signal transduction histidine kinase
VRLPAAAGGADDRAARRAHLARAIGERTGDRRVTVLDAAGRVVVGDSGGARVAAAGAIASGVPAFTYRGADARVPRGREVFVAQRRTADGWRVIVEQPVHAALREAERSAMLALASALGTMVLAVLFAHAVAARVTRPLDEVVRAVRRLSVGDAQGGVATVDASAPAELRALARDFNEMAARLRASYGQLHDALCEREDANARLGDVLARLDGTVRERTADLQLAVARAEEASAAKSRFLAHMSHELRTPLNSVIGFTNILRKNRHGTLRPDQLTYLDRVVANAGHLLLVINDILDLSKVEAGRVELVVERVRVDELARETAAQFEAQVRDRGIRLDVVAPPGAVWADTDAGRLRQVLINLVGNAVKFTPRGSVTVVVTADLHTGALAGIDVCDTGLGIDAHRLATIFDAFEQGDAGSARQFEGTGLGLTISRALCRLLGFDLEAHSVEGEGSVFAVRPLRDAGVAAAAAA